MIAFPSDWAHCVIEKVLWAAEQNLTSTKARLEKEALSNQTGSQGHRYVFAI